MNCIEPIAQNVRDFIQTPCGKLILRKGINVNDHEIVLLGLANSEEIQITKKANFQLHQMNYDHGKIWLKKWEGASIYFDLNRVEVRETTLPISKFIEPNVALCIDRRDKS